MSYAISFSLFVGVLAGGFLFPFLPWLLLRMGIWVYEIVFRCCSSQWDCTGRDGLDSG